MALVHVPVPWPVDLPIADTAGPEAAVDGIESLHQLVGAGRPGIVEQRLRCGVCAVQIEQHDPRFLVGDARAVGLAERAACRLDDVAGMISGRCQPDRRRAAGGARRS